jgi:hypothetical protein
VRCLRGAEPKAPQPKAAQAMVLWGRMTNLYTAKSLCGANGRLL